MRRPIAALAAVLVVAAAACGSSEAETAPTSIATSVASTNTSTTEATATTTAPEPIEISVAKASMEAWNSGDLDAYLGFFAEDAEFYKAEWAIADPDVRDGLEYWMALGDETLIEECEIMADGRVRCRCRGANELSGPAGVFSESDWYFWFEDDVIVRASPSGRDLNEFWFTRAMTLWMMDAYPDVWESRFALDELCIENDSYNCRESWRATAETAIALLEYGAEFIEQSPDYPLAE